MVSRRSSLHQNESAESKSSCVATYGDRREIYRSVGEYYEKVVLGPSFRSADGGVVSSLCDLVHRDGSHPRSRNGNERRVRGERIRRRGGIDVESDPEGEEVGFVDHAAP